MVRFFDTSAVVPLVISEPHSEAAGKLWAESTTRFAWQWLRVEAEAALVRRKVPPVGWSHWRKIEDAIHWIEPERNWLQQLRSFNRGVGLRAADAGHLYVMERSLHSVPELQLVTFDREMRAAAENRGIACLPERMVESRSR
jgi:predicted nucleic acid-binding protein